MVRARGGTTPGMGKLSVILPAAGRSTRFGGERNKLHETLAGKSVLRLSAQAFLAREDVAKVIIATTPEASGLPAPPPPFEPFDSRICFTPGGESRAHSVRRALEQTPADIHWVAIHDAARPLVSAELIERVFRAAQEHGAAAPALPVALTIKQANGPLPAPVERTLPRQTLWAMQTPQIMRRDDLLSAYARCPIPLEQVTDDAQLLELVGQSVWLVAGEERNLKITTRMDIAIAQMLLAKGS